MTMSAKCYRCLLVGCVLLLSVAAAAASENIDDIDVISDDATSKAEGTCPCYSTGRNCVSSCYGMPDGDYQSCRCCHGNQAYVSCSGGRLFYRPCPANLVWADDIKRCNYTSRFCNECGPLPPPPPPTPGRCPCLSTGSRCISSCRGQPDGDYQSCRCCHGQNAFITCSNGLTYFMPCPANLVWADNVKQCNYTSTTCNECTREPSIEKILKWNQL